ncbi:MAG: UDP-glucose/GDP-mannose dehydrogenase family protein [Patescibacteria group bacterium]
MRVTIIGTGYVGLVSGACLADLGHQVICVDTDEAKIDQLKQGSMPIYEPGLEELVKRNVAAGRLKFTTSFAAGIPGAEVISIAVGTPSASDGSVDMQYVDAAARMIGTHLAGYAVIADKSTVPVGTAERVAILVKEATPQAFDVVSNPEFLREGHAVFDFLKPARIVIGAAAQRAADVMLGLYAHIDCPKLVMDTRSAELTKYAANSFLATKISFINEVAQLCEMVGADVDHVAAGIGSDPRIGKDFLRPGPGWGGSCFPKDVKAFLKLGEEYGRPMHVVKAAWHMNQSARLRLVERLEKRLGSLEGKTICVLGLAFKGNTDDTRESPAVDIIRELDKRGAAVKYYDPEAKCAADLGAATRVHSSYAAAAAAHALVIATEWEEFRTLDLDKLKQAMAGDLILDARNLLDHAAARCAGFECLRIGKPDLTIDAPTVTQ